MFQADIEIFLLLFETLASNTCDMSIKSHNLSIPELSIRMQLELVGSFLSI